MPFFSQNSMRSQRVLELPFIRFKLCNEFSQSIPRFPDNINFPSSRNGPPLDSSAKTPSQGSSQRHAVFAKPCRLMG